MRNSTEGTDLAQGHAGRCEPDRLGLAQAGHREGGGGAPREGAGRPLDAQQRPQSFGYRLHVGVDQGSKLIRNVAFTPANINDSSVADGLISGEVYGDKGYESKKRHRRLRQAGI
jgi:IS5 family transposase